MKEVFLRNFLIWAAALLLFPLQVWSDSISDNPILFVTAVPNPQDFGTMAATFSNHVANPSTAFRGGDLWIRYPDGSLKNLTEAAGFGNTGVQGANSIAVRDPAVHWNGTKALFSMVVGAPTKQYELGEYRWQLYEIVGLGQSDTPVISKVTNQPTDYNNISPIYGSDDSIIFSSDRPRDDTVLHTYPQRDEYESAVVVTGLWKLSMNGDLSLLDHAPSGDFNPIIDSFGRVIFTRWDHLQRDQQNVGVSFGAYNYKSETSTEATTSAAESFPEPRDTDDPDYQSTINLHTLNHFFPWMINQDGTDLETLNHIGRQEIGIYSERSFNDDPNVEEFYKQYTTGKNQNQFTIFLHIKESPSAAGTFIGTSCQEFGTHSAGQIISITGAPGVNPDNMTVSFLTHPDTSGATDTPSADHSGLYRDPLPLSNGHYLVSHTSNTRTDTNIGSADSPLSRYDFRIKLLTQSGTYYSGSTFLTSGISKSVSFWSPDSLVSYNGLLWEIMPVEVKSRPIPTAVTSSVPTVEQQVFQSAGVSISELKDYLTTNNLALVVSRNVTARDRNDRQQPTNLRVTGTSTAAIPNSGKVYDVSFLEFYQGDLIRGYNQGNSTGRRVLAQKMHSVIDGLNPTGNGTTQSSVRIASDGSMAAFVPARRALSWQLTNDDGEPVVRERYWLTFQPGEIRVCTTCHGINTADHLGNPPPENSPLALAQLLEHWKRNPSGDPSNGEYSLEVSTESKAKAQGKYTLTANGGDAADSLFIRASIGKRACNESKTLSPGSNTRSLSGKFPAMGKSKLNFSLHMSSSEELLADTSVKVKGKGKTRGARAVKKVCRKLFRALTNPND